MLYIYTCICMYIWIYRVLHVPSNNTDAAKDIYMSLQSL